MTPSDEKEKPADPAVDICEQAWASRSSDTPSQALLDQFRADLSSESVTVIDKDGNRYQCSLRILRASSPVFAAMLQPGAFKEGEKKVIELPDVGGADLPLFLEALHLGDALELSRVARTLTLAHRFQATYLPARLNKLAESEAFLALCSEEELIELVPLVVSNAHLMRRIAVELVVRSSTLCEVKARGLARNKPLRLERGGEKRQLFPDEIFLFDALFPTSGRNLINACLMALWQDGSDVRKGCPDLVYAKGNWKAECHLQVGGTVRPLNLSEVLTASSGYTLVFIL